MRSVPKSAMKILYATSEMTPLAKTGGLADVAGALPHALGALGHDVAVVMPFYGTIDRQAYDLQCIIPELIVDLPVGKRIPALWHTTLPNHKGEAPVSVFLVEDAGLYQRPELYAQNGSIYAFESSDKPSIERLKFL